MVDQPGAERGAAGGCSRLVLLSALLAVGALPGVVVGGSFPIDAMTDQTPTAPLANPLPAAYGSRYVSGFGTGGSFTVFFAGIVSSTCVKVAPLPGPALPSEASESFWFSYWLELKRRRWLARSSSGRPSSKP